LLLLLAAGVAHVAFCEWRTVEFDPAHAAAYDGRVLWSVRRASHPTGNAAAFDALMAEMDVYHADWIECWEDAAEEGACREERESGADATTRAVRLADCERRTGLDVSRRPVFLRCLAERGRPDAPPPRWTRDELGSPRFPGPYWTLTGLLAEDLGGPLWASRAAGALLGVSLPVVLLGAALASLRRAFSQVPPDAARDA